MKGPDRVGELRGAVANHYLVMWPAASFCVARVAFTSIYPIDKIWNLVVAFTSIYPKIYLPSVRPLDRFLL